MISHYFWLAMKKKIIKTKKIICPTDIKKQRTWWEEQSLSDLVWWWYLTCHQPSPAPDSVKQSRYFFYCTTTTTTTFGYFIFFYTFSTTLAKTFFPWPLEQYILRCDIIITHLFIGKVKQSDKRQRHGQVLGHRAGQSRPTTEGDEKRDRQQSWYFINHTVQSCHL